VTNEYYFQVEGSSSDLAAIRWEIESFCEQNGLEVVYYRKLKHGHVPTYRECKVIGNVYLFKEWLDTYAPPVPREEMILP
jgi:hypothetical protein